MARLAAFIVLLIPGLFAAGGIKLMRDSIFGILFKPFPFIWLQFVVGLLFCSAGLAFLQASSCVVIEKTDVYKGDLKKITKRLRPFQSP